MLSGSAGRSPTCPCRQHGEVTTDGAHGRPLRWSISVNGCREVAGAEIMVLTPPAWCAKPARTDFISPSGVQWRFRVNAAVGEVLGKW